VTVFVAIMSDGYDRQGGRVVMRDQVCILEEQSLVCVQLKSLASI
jgi:hypothetical protein